MPLRQAETDLFQAVTMPTFVLHGINMSLPGVTVLSLDDALGRVNCAFNIFCLSIHALFSCS